MPLDIIYEEPPNADRWIRFDRYPRAVVRRLVRGKPQPGGVMRWFLNLCAGLDEIGVHYRVNRYRKLRQAPDKLACVIGKSFVLEKLGRDQPSIRSCWRSLLIPWTTRTFWINGRC